MMRPMSASAVLPDPLGPVRPARREVRALAFVADGLALALLQIPFLAAGALVVLAGSDWLAQDPDGAVWTAGYAVGGLGGLAPLLYAWWGGWQGGTPGMRLAGLTVRRTDGGRVSAARALGRAALLYPSVGGLGLGLAWAIIDGSGRAAHDRLAGTVVVEVRP